MKKQVNMWLDDNVYELLVKEAGRMQAETGLIIRPTTMAAILVKQSLNGKPDNKQDVPDVPKPAGPIRNGKPDNEPDNNKVVSPPADDTPSETTTDNPFSDLTF